MGRDETQVLVETLRVAARLVRCELYHPAAALSRARIPAHGQRLAYIVMDAELDALICSGPRRGKQFTYALVDERVPRAAAKDRDDALGELARRYFRSHGPATLRDFVWWSGLRVSDARRAVDIARLDTVEDAGLSLLEYLTSFSQAKLLPLAGRPMLWHIMNIYSAYGFNDFIIACGYKGEVIKDYFRQLYYQSADLVVDLENGSFQTINPQSPKWKVAVIDTGEGITMPVGPATLGRVLNVDHHAPGPEMARSVSSAVTVPADVAEGVWRAATDGTKTLRFAAGADAAHHDAGVRRVGGGGEIEAGGDPPQVAYVLHTGRLQRTDLVLRVAGREEADQREESEHPEQDAVGLAHGNSIDGQAHRRRSIAHRG